MFLLTGFAATSLHYLVKYLFSKTAVPLAILHPRLQFYPESNCYNFC